MDSRRMFTLASMAFLVVVGLGLKIEKGKLVWVFLRSPYSSKHDSAGIPNDIDARRPVGQDLLDRIAHALPETVDIRNHHPELITDDYGANVRLVKDADVFVTFVHEGAGYKNSFGFFTFPDGEQPSDRMRVAETIVFPNASYWNDGGSGAGLRSGDTMRIGHFAAGTNIGFVVVSDGFDSKTGVTTKPTGGPPGGDWIFYTVKALNPEADQNLKAHTVLLSDKASRSVVLGMEDLRRDRPGCDHDFNDIVFVVTSEPIDAIDVEDIAPMPDPVNDRDGDGVLDPEDEYPDDNVRAFSAVTSGTVAFEDSWPLHGDYDFNDVVVGYRVHRVTNAAGRVVEIRARFEVRARGSAEHLGLGLALPGLSRGDITAATLARDAGGPQTLTMETGHGDAVVYRLSDDLTVLTPPPDGCATYNTARGCARASAVALELSILLKAGGVQPAAVGLPPFDPFLFSTAERGMEVHLPTHAPTALADKKAFGGGDDDSKPAKGRWYLSFCDLPWALNVPAEWSWPLEGVPIIVAYPSFSEWAHSLGAKATDWYAHPVASQVWE